MTVAVVPAVYSLATPGANAPNCAGAPIVRASVAGTVPPTVPGVSVWPRTCVLTAEVLPLKSWAIHFSVVLGASCSGSAAGSFRTRAAAAC